MRLSFPAASRMSILAHHSIHSCTQLSGCQPSKFGLNAVAQSACRTLQAVAKGICHHSTHSAAADDTTGYQRNQSARSRNAEFAANQCGISAEHSASMLLGSWPQGNRFAQIRGVDVCTACGSDCIVRLHSHKQLSNTWRLYC